MSIQGEINQLCDAGLLDRLVLGTGEPESRVIVVAEPMRHILEGPYGGNEEFERAAQDLKSLLSDFVRGDKITVSRRSGGSCQLKQLTPTSTEVWEFRSSDPAGDDPGIRTFGRFAALDVFVAFRWQYRGQLGPIGSRQWKHYIDGCVADWRKYFPNSSHLKRKRFHDGYLSNAEEA